MKNISIPVFFVLVFLMMQSCKIMYTPNMQNVPQMKEKNEVRATVGFSDAQAAYAVTDKIAIMANAQYKKPSWTVTSGSMEYKYESKKNLIELGGGYYKKVDDYFTFEAYGGAGYGWLNYNRSYADTSGGQATVYNKFKANATRFFLQPSIGVSTDFADFAISTRFVGLKFRNIDTSGYRQDELLEEDLSGLDKPFYSFFEPAMTLRLGAKYVKFHIQAIYSLKLNEEKLNYMPFTVNFGVHLNIAQRFKKS